LVSAKTPYKVISVASPTSKSDLEESGFKVGATIVTQINHPNDPVANGVINENATYEVKHGLKDLINDGTIPIYQDLVENHPFKNNYI